MEPTVRRASDAPRFAVARITIARQFFQVHHRPSPARGAIVAGTKIAVPGCLQQPVNTMKSTSTLPLYTLKGALPVVFAALLFPTPAAADDCQAHLVEVNRLSTEVPTNSNHRRTLRRLGEAALLLDAAGRGELCKEVTSEMQAMLEARAEQAAEERRREARQAAAEAARPLAELEAPLDATALLVGLEAINLQGESLATVDRVIVEPNRGAVLYVVLDREGFLGILSDDVAVPWSALAITPERDAVVLDVTREAFEQAPELDEATSGAIAPAWLN